MEGREFLAVANRLHRSDHEADRRTSVSRAYYAVFNHVKPILENIGVTLSFDASAHKKIYRYLYNSGLDEVEDVADHLNSLRTKRNDADYDMKCSGFDNNNCLLLFKTAQRCINAFNGVDLKNLKEKILEYKAKINE